MTRKARTQQRYKPPRLVATSKVSVKWVRGFMGSTQPASQFRDEEEEARDSESDDQQSIKWPSCPISIAWRNEQCSSMGWL